MPFSLLRLSKLKLISVAIITLCAIGTLAWGSRNKLYPVTEKKLAAIPISMTAAQTPPQNSADRLDVELITLTSRGFEPKEITRPKGKFRLVVETRTGLEQPVTLSLSEEKKNKLKEYKANGSRKGWNSTFDLNQGRYVLSVAENPDWTCYINVTVK